MFSSFVKFYSPVTFLEIILFSLILDPAVSNPKTATFHNTWGQTKFSSPHTIKNAQSFTCIVTMK